MRNFSHRGMNNERCGRPSLPHLLSPSLRIRKPHNPEMLSSTSLRQAGHSPHAFAQAVRVVRWKSAICGEQTRAFQVKQRWCCSGSIKWRGGFDHRRQGRCLLSSTTVTHHLGVVKHRCLSQDSRQVKQQPSSPLQRWRHDTREYRVPLGICCRYLE